MRTKEEINKERERLRGISNLSDFERGEHDVFLIISDDIHTQKIKCTQKAVEGERENLEFAESKNSKEYYIGYINTLEWILGKRDKIKVEFT